MRKRQRIFIDYECKVIAADDVQDHIIVPKEEPLEYDRVTVHQGLRPDLFNQFLEESVAIIQKF